MATVSIIYFSGFGHTAKLAESVEKGTNSVEGTVTNLISIDGKDIIEGKYHNEEVLKILDESDAIIFGSPTYMGGVSSQFKAFADATVKAWGGQTWRNKLAAGFTVSGALSGDKLHTLQYFNHFAMQHGMIWISLGELPQQENGLNHVGSWMVAMAQALNADASVTPNEDDKRTAEVLGRRVALFANQTKFVDREPVNS
ncbi:flavodoxin family protein [Chryseobacterium sp. MYb264]|uniref:flavodoxin family protein n=1 Tax=Chryseobacterium sp. MYb264 TaxID=2745153 RepID=UPI002E0E8CA3|nr:flavodoxin family protein [Chryseobacterium sp. MYb264]